MQAPYGGRAGGAAAGGRCWGQGERGAGFETDHIIPFCLRCCALRASTWLTADLYRGSVLYIYIYIVCNYSQPVAAAVATDIYIYTRIHIIYTHISISIRFVLLHIAGMHTARLYTCTAPQPYSVWQVLAMQALPTGCISRLSSSQQNIYIYIYCLLQMCAEEIPAKHYIRQPR